MDIASLLSIWHRVVLVLIVSVENPHITLVCLSAIRHKALELLFRDANFCHHGIEVLRHNLLSGAVLRLHVTISQQ